MKRRLKKSRELEHWLQESATPLFVLDAERCLSGFNAGCQALTGWTSAEVLGVECRYASVADVTGLEALASSLCPPPEVLAGSEVSVPAFLVHRDGQSLPRMLHFFPLRDEAGQVSGALGLVAPLNQPRPAVRVSAARELHAELAALRTTLRLRFGPNTLVASSPPMHKVLTQVELAQQSASSVLLVGEAGTGKEHLARLIHLGSAARASWFVPLECGHLGPEELDRVWNRLQDVHRLAESPGPQPGTLYLADADLLHRDLQQRLVIEFMTDDVAIRPRIRLLASLRSSPAEALVSERIRPDFLALLSTLTIEVPPLREREDDVRLLMQHFLEDANRQGVRQVGGFDDEATQLLLQYDWPGNLDELSIVVREAHAQSTDSLIHHAHLPFRFRSALEARELPPPPEPLPIQLEDLLTRIEFRLVSEALERSKYNKSKAAERLGINRAKLYRRMQQLGIEDREE